MQRRAFRLLPTEVLAAGNVMMRNAKVLVALVAMTQCAVGLPAAQDSIESTAVAFDDPRWTFEAKSAEIVEFAGRQALRLADGRALLPEVSLAEGTIDFDLAFGPERGFSGALFRFLRPGDYEHVYFRPHQSGMPDASQYTPVVQGVSGWQLYHSPAFAAPFSYRYGEWMHVTIAFSGSRATVRLDGETLYVPRLKRPVEAGCLGVNAAFATAYFSGFRYSAAVPPDFPATRSDQIEIPEAPDGLVRSWRISEAFPAELRPAITLADDFHDGLSWRTVEIEPEGFVNLAWAEGTDDQHRAVLAEFDLPSEVAGFRLVQFGYSDLVRAFVDGREIYRGTNLYRSRDYRYLGTIGLFDVLVVPVRPGLNTVTFVVTENYGGWGVMAAVQPLESSPALRP